MAAVLAGVALLHALAFWLLTRRPPAPRPTPRAAVALRIVLPKPVPSPTAEPPAPQQPQPAAPRHAPAPRPRPDEPVHTAPPTLPAEPAAGPAPAAPQAITVAPPSPPASAPELPLRLDLPRRATAGAGAPLRNPALDDPRANTPRRGFGDGLAAALGSDDRLVEEDRGDGRRRIRQGRDCVDVRPARNTGLDPFNQSTRPSPKLVEPCP